MGYPRYVTQPYGPAPTLTYSGPSCTPHPDRRVVLTLSSPPQHSSSSSLGAASTSGVGHAAKSEADASAVKLEAAQTALTALTSDGGGGETVGGASGPSAASGSQAKEPRAATGEGNSSALHWLADLATQKAKDDTKGSVETWPGVNAVQVLDYRAP